MKKVYSSPFQGVPHSPWPFFTGMGVFCLSTGLVGWLNHWDFQDIIPFDGVVEALVLLSVVASCWWRDVIRESTFQGEHTKKVQKALRVGFFLFVCSEAMLFFSLFWAFFHSSLAPSVELGCYWPPMGIKPINPWRAPLTMTTVLVCSGVFANWGLHSVKSGCLSEGVVGVGVSVLLGCLFSYFQLVEYWESSFTISDSVYGSVFFLITGFHGMHVVAGTVFLAVQLCRLIQYHFSTGHHLGLEFSVWYWHFVDVIWLFVMLFLYIWGGWYGS